MKNLVILIYLFTFSFLTASCNYNYYVGQQMEEEKRYEQANIEYHRAYTDDPDDDDFKSAYKRTGRETVIDLLKRYKKYLNEKKFRSAFNRLERARVLEPENEIVLNELKKWVRVLAAGKVSMKFKSLKRELQLADRMQLGVRINTPSPEQRLFATVDDQSGLFFAEDVLYDPPQDLLMFYSIGSIGVKLSKSVPGSRSFRKNEFKNFINLRTPVLTKISGKLDVPGTERKRASEFFPYDLLKKAETPTSWTPPRGIRYSLELNKDRITVKSSVKYIDFVPQLMYLNHQDRRVFFDFGHIEIQQKKPGGAWSFKKLVQAERDYYKSLTDNLILNPYFYFREGAFYFTPHNVNN